MTARNRRGLLGLKRAAIKKGLRHPKKLFTVLESKMFLVASQCRRNEPQKKRLKISFVFYGLSETVAKKRFFAV